MTGLRNPFEGRKKYEFGVQFSIYFLSHFRFRICCRFIVPLKKKYTEAERQASQQELSSIDQIIGLAVKPSIEDSSDCRRQSKNALEISLLCTRLYINKNLNSFRLFE